MVIKNDHNNFFYTFGVMRVEKLQIPGVSRYAMIGLIKILPKILTSLLCVYLFISSKPLEKKSTYNYTYNPPAKTRLVNEPGKINQKNEKVSPNKKINENATTEVEEINTSNDLNRIMNIKLENSIEQRKTAFREMVIINPNGKNSLPILAYEGIEIKDSDIDYMIEKFKHDETADFILAQLVRILYFTNEYDQKILPVLKDLDYWLKKGEKKYCYWSENHMILWMSAAYLLKQREGWEMSDTLEERLKHYLKLKLTHGYYEFFSSVYQPFTLAGLLNLSDFAKDKEIKSDAEKAAKILLKQMLLVFNENGAFYPAAARNHSNMYKYFKPSSIMMILTGLGAKRKNADFIGGFLSTSSIDLSDVAVTWVSSLNTRLKLGNTRKDYTGLTRKNKILFQWSSGKYFQPDVADETKWVIDSYDLKNHPHFKIFKKIPDFPDEWSNAITKLGATWSRSSSISCATIDIYKNKGIVLTSLHNYYGGYVGYQQWPWAATIEDIAVWTQSGKIRPGWEKSKMSANSHLPKVFQDNNVAMIVYNPHMELRALSLIGKYDISVSLYWPFKRFDQSFEWKKWIFGRKGESYIAVFHYKKIKKKNIRYYSKGKNGKQMWAVVVGNRGTHHSFKEFIEVVKKAKVKQKSEWDLLKLKWLYSTRIIVDGKNLECSW